MAKKNFADQPVPGISVYQRGTTWSFRVTTGKDPLSGERTRINRGGFADDEEAFTAAIKAKEKAERGLYLTPPRRSLGEFLDEWLASIEHSVKDSTFASYEDNVRYYVQPVIGHRNLQRDVTVQMLNTFYRHLLTDGRRKADNRSRMYEYWAARKDKRGGKGPGPTEVARACDVSYHAARKAVWLFGRGRIPTAQAPGLSTKSVRNVHQILHAALHDAVAWGYIESNPAEYASLPRQNRKSRKERKQQTWTVDELAAWLKLALQDRFAGMWVLAATTGMRRSELAGVERDDLDLDRGVLDIGPTRVVVRGKAQDEDGKSAAGERGISLDPFTVAMLRKHLTMLDEERNAFGESYDPGGKLMCWETGKPLHPDTITSRFNLLVDRACARRIRLHDVRHTYATLALDSGIDPKILSDRVGHANLNVTFGLYVHRSAGLDRDAAELIGKAITDALDTGQEPDS